MKNNMKYTDKFFWGGAIAANQCEGAYLEDGKKLTTCDMVTSGTSNTPRYIYWEKPSTGEKGKTTLFHSKFPDGSIPVIDNSQYYPSWKGIDFYHTYKKDIALLAEMGLNCFRFSINWSRIYPNGDDKIPNEAGLSYYDAIIDECLKYGMEPFVTLQHYELPLNLTIKYGGWKNRKLIDFFVRYCTTVFKRYNGKVKFYTTFNENNTLVNSTYLGAGMLDNSKQAIAQAYHNQFVASALAVKKAHEINSELKVGQMIAFTVVYPYSSDPADQLYALKKEQERLFPADVQTGGKYPNWKLKEYEKNHICLDDNESDYELLENFTSDFLSFSNYGSWTITTHSDVERGNVFMGVMNPFIVGNEWGMGVDDNALRIALNKLWDRYHKPLWIAENGYGAADVLTKNHHIHDEYRIQYLKTNIDSLKQAIYIDMIPVIGYTLWAPIDLISVSSGEMKKRYGLIYVDMDNLGNGTLLRYKKDSFYWFKDLMVKEGKEVD